RRHTRFSRDWSSDVCSSDLTEEGIEIDLPLREVPRSIGVGEPAVRLMIGRMARAGLLERSGDRLTVFDTARLDDFLAYLEMKWKFEDVLHVKLHVLGCHGGELPSCRSTCF